MNAFLFKKDSWLSKILNKNSYIIKKKHLLNKNKYSLKYFKKDRFFYFKSRKKLKKKILFKLVSQNQLLNNKNYHSLLKVKLKDSHKIVYVNNKRNSIRKMLFKCIKNNFLYSRFSVDKNFKKNFSDKVYYKWTIDSLKNKKKKILCLYVKNLIVSFLILKFNNMQCIIDLICTNIKYKKKGYASLLIKFALAKYSKFSFLVGTEKKNKRAIKFYENLGFKRSNVLFVYHLHT
jgi:predicted GNAT family acetyltransferase